jgi:hypothetical protein
VIIIFTVQCMWLLLSGVRFITSTLLSCNRPLQYTSTHQSVMFDVWQKTRPRYTASSLCQGRHQWMWSLRNCNKTTAMSVFFIEWRVEITKRFCCPSHIISGYVHQGAPAGCTHNRTTQQVLLHVKPRSWREDLRTQPHVFTLACSWKHLYFSISTGKNCNCVTPRKQKSFIQRTTWFLALFSEQHDSLL